MEIDPTENGDGDSDLKLSELPSFFKGKTFFLYEKFEPSERRTMLRFITAYDGWVFNFNRHSKMVTGLSLILSV